MLFAAILKVTLPIAFPAPPIVTYLKPTKDSSIPSRALLDTVKVVWGLPEVVPKVIISFWPVLVSLSLNGIPLKVTDSAEFTRPSIGPSLRRS